MTELKAKEVLENESCYECSYGTLFGASECKNINCEVANATKLEINALEKQIAKKPIDKLMYFECPGCGEVEIMDCGYCPVCGQKLDWWNEDAE